MSVACPAVGVVYWKLIAQRGWVRHEVRAVFDDHVAVRRWTPFKQRWIYEVEPVFIWKMHFSPIGDSPRPAATTDSDIAAKLNREFAERGHG